MPKTPHSSLNLSEHVQPLCYALSRNVVRSPSPSARSASSTRHVDRRSVPPTAIRSRLPPVRPMTRAGTPAAAARSSTLVDIARARPTRRRARPTRRTAPPRRSVRGRARHRARASIETSAPMPPVSKQHSASVTAMPPSEQSCADRMQPLVGQRDEQRLQRALRRRDRAPAACRAPDRARP